MPQLVSDRAVKFQALWSAATDTPAPNLQLFMRWCVKYGDAIIERAILKTGAKFRFRNQDVEVVHRYANGLLKNLHEESNASRVMSSATGAVAPRKVTLMNEETLKPHEVEAHLEAANTAAPNLYRDIAGEHLRIGKVDDLTSIADAKELLNEHFAVGQ